MDAAERINHRNATRTSSDHPPAGPALGTVISSSELLDNTSEWKELLRAPSAKNDEVVEASPLTEPVNNSPHRKSERGGETQC
jgi:hypothetical protein